MSDIISNIFALQSIEPLEAVIRVSLAALFGVLIGFDRDLKGKPIDFRAYIIVTIATCIIAIVGTELSYMKVGGQGDFMVVDITRIISGILTGIGFLGAGAIIKRSDESIIGSATGASIWASGIMGVCLGLGLYGLAFLCFLGIFLSLFLGGYFMRFAFGKTDTET